MLGRRPGRPRRACRGLARHPAAGARGYGAEEGSGRTPGPRDRPRARARDMPVGRSAPIGDDWRDAEFCWASKPLLVNSAAGEAGQQGIGGAARSAGSGPFERRGFMICSQCGNHVVEGAACPRCGAQMNANQGPEARYGLPAGASAGAHMGHAATVVRPAFNLDLKRLTRDDRIVGVATLVLFISLFLPWFTVSVRGFGSGSVNGLYHGYMYIDLILALAILAFLVVRPAAIPAPRRSRAGAAGGHRPQLAARAHLVRVQAG